MQPFIYKHWHVWQGTNGLLVSNEESKQLSSFKTSDDAINWLYVKGEKDAAKALYLHTKQGL